MQTNEQLQNIKKEIDFLLQTKSKIIIAIDGNCGAGKTSLANALREAYHCDIIRMDDFFLQSYQRTPQRLEEPGGNIDYERFIKEVVTLLRAGANSITYKPFSCETMSLLEPVVAAVGEILIIEGTYSLHDLYDDIYDLKIFLEIDSNTQMLRIINRNGPLDAQTFKNKWIPFEKKYFDAMKIKTKANIYS